MGHLFWSKDAQEKQRNIIKLFHQSLMLDIWLKSSWKEFICWWVNKSKPKIYYVPLSYCLFNSYILQWNKKAPPCTCKVVMNSVERCLSIDRFICFKCELWCSPRILHWSNLLPYHSVNGRTGCWVFSLETWKFHTSEIQLVQCLEKIQKYSLTVQSLY